MVTLPNPTSITLHWSAQAEWSLEQNRAPRYLLQVIQVADSPCWKTILPGSCSNTNSNLGELHVILTHEGKGGRKGKKTKTKRKSKYGESLTHLRNRGKFHPFRSSLRNRKGGLNNKSKDLFKSRCYSSSSNCPSSSSRAVHQLHFPLQFNQHQCFLLRSEDLLWGLMNSTPPRYSKQTWRQQKRLPGCHFAPCCHRWFCSLSLCPKPDFCLMMESAQTHVERKMWRQWRLRRPRQTTTEQRPCSRKM